MNTEGDMLPGSNRAAWAENIDYTKQGATCRKCGYLLRELKEDRCPECGNAFDRHDRQTMKVPGYSRPFFKSPPVRRTFASQIVLASTMATIYTVFPAQASCGAWFIGVVAWLCIAVAWSNRSAIPKDRPRLEEGPSWRGLVKTLLIISILGSFRFHQCYHATTVWIGSLVGLSYSDKGGPCGNDPHCGGRRLIGNFYLANVPTFRG
jgi:hypothetical protein